MGEWADYWYGPEPVSASWPGVCGNCGQGFPKGAPLVPLGPGWRSLTCCPEEAP